MTTFRLHYLELQEVVASNHFSLGLMMQEKRRIFKNCDFLRFRRDTGVIKTSSFHHFHCIIPHETFMNDDEGDRPFFSRVFRKIIFSKNKFHFRLRGGKAKRQFHFYFPYLRIIFIHWARIHFMRKEQKIIFVGVSIEPFADTRIHSTLYPGW